MMTPPTVAPGSAGVMRRHDAAPSSFYVPSPLQQQSSMSSQPQEGNAGSNKQKKSWGERLKLGKSREDRPDSYLLQEYRSKYGTLSSGSALSKSMKYAETWLYGSVAVRAPVGARPSLFLYHPPPPPPGPSYAVVMCSCPEFLTVTARSKKSTTAVCKKCGGSRALWTRGGGTVRGTVRGGGTLRLGGGSSGQNRVRPSLSNLSPAANIKTPPQQQQQQPLKAVTPDPYDLMRRNRLGGVNGGETALQFCPEAETPRARAKSTSPCRRSLRRSPSPTRPGNGRRLSRRDLEWDRAWNSTLDSSDNKRKSILECDVNAYELIAKYLKNGSRSLEENGDTSKIDEYIKTRNSDVATEVLLDDELSDDLSDNALENSSGRISSQSRIPSRSLQSAAKTRNIDKLSKSPAAGVTLGGQRVRIFNASPVPSPQDSDADGETGARASLIPRLSSPRRPPRKLRAPYSTPGGADADDTENESVRGGGQTPPTTDGRPTEGACVIKSILKKPSTASPGETATGLKTFGDTVSKPDSAVAAPASTSSVSGQHSPSPEAAGSGSSDFYLPTFQEFKQQNRRKKQVQFKVSDDVTLLQPVEEETSTTTPTPFLDTAEDLPRPDSSEGQDKTSAPVRGERRKRDAGCAVRQGVVAGGSCDVGLQTESTNGGVNEESAEQVKTLNYFDEGDVVAVNSNACGKEDSAGRGRDSSDDPSAATAVAVVDEAADVSSASVVEAGLLREHPGRILVTLRRSHSDRQLRGGASQESDGPASLFNDTMRLRLRPGRPDIRHVFSDPGPPGTYTEHAGVPRRPQRMLSPGRSRPKEPPPPPPPPPSFAFCPEKSKKDLPELPPRQIFPFTKKQIEQMNQQARQFSIKSNAKQRKVVSSIAKLNKSSFDSETSVPSNIRPVSWSPLTDTSSLNSCEATTDVKRKIHRNSDPGPGPPTPKRVVRVENQPGDQMVKTSLQREMNSVPRLMPEQSQTEDQQINTVLQREMNSVRRLTPEQDQPDTRRMDPVLQREINSVRSLTLNEDRSEDQRLDTVFQREINSVRLACHQDIFEDQRKDPTLQTEINSVTRYMSHQDRPDENGSSHTPQMLDLNESKVRTIVNVSSPSPGSPLADVHRLQIKAEDTVVDVSPGPHRRTSILINGGECAEEIRHHSFSTSVNASVTSLIVQDNASTSPIKQDSSNKVTISVGGISEQILQNQKTTNKSSLCTIIDTSPPSTLNLGKMYNKSSLTVLSSSPSQVNVIPVTPEPQVQRTLLILDHNDNNERNSDVIFQCWTPDSVSATTDGSTALKSTITVADNKKDDAEKLPCAITLLSKPRGVESPSGAESIDDEDALKNPVEAIRRNLIPHVCGKKDEAVDEDSSATERLNKLIEMQGETDDVEPEALKEGDYFVAVAASKLLGPISSDETPLYSNVPSISKSSEDILPTVIEHEEDTGDDEVFQTKPISADDTSESTDDCRSDEKNFSECESASSSMQPENEGTSGKEDANNTSSDVSLEQFYTPGTEKDNQDQEVELRKEMAVDTESDNIYECIKDPIYEEIPDTPPPLPLSPPPSLDDLEESRRSSRSIFEGASKYDILSYLVGAKERGIVPEEMYFGGSSNGDEIVEIIDGKSIQDEEEGGVCHQRISSLDLSSRVSHLSNASDSSEDSCNLIISNIGDTPSSPNKVRKSSAEIERNDSGVGSETSKSSRSRWQHCGPAGSIREDQQHLCEDCDQPVETQVTDSGVMFAPLVCRKCGKKRAERKEIIAEIVETEVKYGRDLQIILEEFYRPMLVAGLLSPEQLTAIFLNVEELLEHNGALAEKLRDNMEIAVEQGDEDLLTVNIGKLFLEAAPMLHAFESYCTRQGGASLLLSNLEKEKELLRIFLRVSQMENAVLRRMNLNSFLMVPVQRVTKYPLLLARLHKVTPAHHEGRELLRQAQQKIELHLEHMNSEAKDISTTRLWRRISIMNGRRSSSETDMLSIKLRKMALDILEWNHDEVRFAMEGKLLYTNPADNNWRKGRTIKLNHINALLVTNGKPTEDYRPDSEDNLMFPRKTGVREATLLLLKEKCGRYTQLREPLYLDKCIVCSEADWEDYFEVQELASKDTFIFKAEDGDRTKLWYRQLQYHAQGMGAWRRRRNAMANIMINGMQTRN